MPTLRERLLRAVEKNKRLYNTTILLLEDTIRVAAFKKDWGTEYILYLPEGKEFSVLAYESGSSSCFMSRRSR